jgi:two-component system CheB/CheR fusion protein
VQARADAADAPPRRQRRILIVDDNKDGADSLRHALEQHGHQVVVAYSSPQALAVGPGFGPDVVRCDLGLPQMDGFAIVRALRQDPRTAADRVVAVTGYGQDEVHQRCLAEGFDMHLTKPVDLEELCHWLETPAGQ